MDAQKESSHETLNSLLRAEFSASETYQHVLEKARDQARHSAIQQIFEEHRESAELLRAQIAELGGAPDRRASTWKNIDILASILSRDPLQDPIAIKALIEGEEQDVLTYEEALTESGLDGEARDMVERMLLPRTRSHIATLEKLLDAV